MSLWGTQFDSEKKLREKIPLSRVFTMPIPSKETPGQNRNIVPVTLRARETKFSSGHLASRCFAHFSTG